MDKVTKAVTKSIKKYPTLFRCRTDVLEHRFCTIGGGYEWVDGELINPFQEDSKYKKPKSKSKSLDKSPAEILKSLPDDISAEIILRDKWLYAKEKFIKKNAKYLAHVRWCAPNAISSDISFGNNNDLNKPGRVYPLDEQYSNLCNVPDNVERSWLAAAREIATVILRQDIICIQSSRIEANRAIAQKVLDDLNKRFPA